MAAPRSNCQGKGMSDKDKAERLAAALRDNLRRRKAQARELVLPGTGRGTAERSSGVEGASRKAEDPLDHPSDGSPPRSGED